MIKFFRHIRQRMLTENPHPAGAGIRAGKMSKYLLYAIGEIVLVVIGILIALQINNWNEGQKLEQKRQILIASLIEDFEYNRLNLIEDEIPFTDSIMSQMQSFFELSGSDTALVTVDSLRVLAYAFYTGHVFSPNLTAYNEAVSTGSLGLLKSKDILQEFTLFIQASEEFDELLGEDRYSFFNGSSWELRKTIPPGWIAGRQPIPGLTYLEYKKVVDSPLGAAALSNTHVLNWNIRNSSYDMHEASENILELLEMMQKQ